MVFKQFKICLKKLEVIATRGTCGVPIQAANETVGCTSIPH